MAIACRKCSMHVSCIELYRARIMFDKSNAP